jgi:hypothetical protein
MILHRRGGDLRSAEGPEFITAIRSGSFSTRGRSPPVVGFERFLSPRAGRPTGYGKTRHQKGYLPRTQKGGSRSDDVQTVKQILAKGPLSISRNKITVRGAITRISTL